jgi:hypothetical protein
MEEGDAGYVMAGEAVSVLVPYYSPLLVGVHVIK